MSKQIEQSSVWFSASIIRWRRWKCTLSKRKAQGISKASKRVQRNKKIDTNKEDDSLFSIHPELFFSMDTLKSVNILSLIHSGKYEKSSYFFYLPEKVI